MEIQYYGANCVRLSDKRVAIVSDDNLQSLGSKTVTSAEDVCLNTFDNKLNIKGRFTISGPGEYEISEVSLLGIPAKAHIDNDGLKSTMYSLQMQGVAIGIIGHIYPDLSDDQLEMLGVIDVLIIPVGGNGYTLDATSAVQIIKKIEPKIVIPTHYADSQINYEVPQAELDVFLKEIGVSDPERLDILKIKDTDLGDKARVIVLNRATTK